MLNPRSAVVHSWAMAASLCVFALACDPGAPPLPVSGLEPLRYSIDGSIPALSSPGRSAEWSADSLVVAERPGGRLAPLKCDASSCPEIIGPIPAGGINSLLLLSPGEGRGVSVLPVTCTRDSGCELSSESMPLNSELSEGAVKFVETHGQGESPPAQLMLEVSSGSIPLQVVRNPMLTSGILFMDGLRRKVDGIEKCLRERQPSLLVEDVSDRPYAFQATFRQAMPDPSYEQQGHILVQVALDYTPEQFTAILKSQSDSVPLQVEQTGTYRIVHKDTGAPLRPVALVSSEDMQKLKKEVQTCSGVK